MLLGNVYILYFKHDKKYQNFVSLVQFSRRMWSYVFAHTALLAYHEYLYVCLHIHRITLYISQNLPIKKLKEGNKINIVDLTISLISQ